MHRIFLVAVTYFCFLLTSPAMAGLEQSFSVRSTEFKQFEASFRAVGGLFAEDGPAGYMRGIRELGNLNYRVLNVFNQYLVAFITANNAAPTEELQSFWDLINRLLERLDPNPANESPRRESNLIKSMTSLTRCYLPENASRAHTAAAAAAGDAGVETGAPSCEWYLSRGFDSSSTSKSSSSSDARACTGETQSSAGGIIQGAIAVVARSLNRQPSTDPGAMAAARSHHRIVSNELTAAAAAATAETPVVRSVARNEAATAAPVARSGIPTISVAATAGQPRVKRSLSWRLLNPFGSHQGSGPSPNQ